MPAENRPAFIAQGLELDIPLDQFFDSTPSVFFRAESMRNSDDHEPGEFKS